MCRVHERWIDGGFGREQTLYSILGVAPWRADRAMADADWAWAWRQELESRHQALTDEAVLPSRWWRPGGPVMVVGEGGEEPTYTGAASAAQHRAEECASGSPPEAVETCKRQALVNHAYELLREPWSLHVYEDEFLPRVNRAADQLRHDWRADWYPGAVWREALSLVCKKNNKPQQRQVS